MSKSNNFENHKNLKKLSWQDKEESNNSNLYKISEKHRTLMINKKLKSPSDLPIISDSECDLVFDDVDIDKSDSISLDELFN
jgi:hypothetical protein